MERKLCSIEGCPSGIFCRGWCQSHYNRWRKYGDPTIVKKKRNVCKEDGCTGWCVSHGWCNLHYKRFIKHPKQKAAREAARVDRKCAYCGTALAPSRPARTEFCNRQCKMAQRVRDGRASADQLRHYYKRNYGLTTAEVATMRAGGCAICGATSSNDRHGQLHIDHCHNTGKVRGALCDSCNTGLGKFDDDPDLLEAAAAYVREHCPDH